MNIGQFSCLPDDILAYIAGFLTVKEKIRLTLLDKQTANVLKIPHAWVGTLDLSEFKSRHVKRIVEIMPSKTFVTKLILGGMFQRLHVINFAEFIVKFPIVQQLNIGSSNQITNGYMKNISSLPLQHLEMSYCNITNAGLACLINMPLNHLNLKHCIRLTGAGFVHFAQMPLNVLDISDCPDLAEDNFSHIAPLPLRKLTLGVGRITPEVTRRFPDLLKCSIIETGYGTSRTW